MTMMAAVRRAIIVLSVGLAGCNPGTPLSANGVVLLRWGHLDAQPLGLMTGQLTFRGGCVGVEGVDKPTVVLWPPNTQFDLSTGHLRLVVDGVPFSEGDVLRVGGGEATDQSWVRSLVGPVPAPCQSDRYLLATRLSLP